MTTAKRNAPLSACIEGNQLVVRIGIDTLAFSAEHCPRFYDADKPLDADGPYVRVTNKRELAKDIVRELLREEEDGTNPLHVLLDDAIEAAREDGSLGFEEEESC